MGEEILALGVGDEAKVDRGGPGGGVVARGDCWNLK